MACARLVEQHCGGGSGAWIVQGISNGGSFSGGSRRCHVVWKSVEAAAEVGFSGCKVEFPCRLRGKCWRFESAGEFRNGVIVEERKVGVRAAGRSRSWSSQRESSIDTKFKGERIERNSEFSSKREDCDVTSIPDGVILQERNLRQMQGRDEVHTERSSRGPDNSLASSTSNLGCEHFDRCSGCVTEKALDQPRVLQDAVSFFRRNGVEDMPLTSCSLWGWRCRAKLAVRGTSENPMIGLFEEGTHIIVDIPDCRAHHPRINEAVELVKEAIKSLGIEPYDEETGSGQLRYVQMVVSTFNTSLPATERYAHGTVQVTLVWNARDEKAAEASLQPMAELLWRRGGTRSATPILHSLWANFQTSRTNVIFGGKWRHILGEKELWERIGGADICFTPASFGQANLQAFDALLRKLQTKVKRGSSVVELYAGVGIIGISLAVTRACRAIKCVEVNKEARDSFQLSVARVPDSVVSKISWHCADAAVSPINWLEGADVVVVDPPRKGLDSTVIEALRTASFRGQGKQKSTFQSNPNKVEKRPWIVRAKQDSVTKDSSIGCDVMEAAWPDTLIYVSCGWQSFKQDFASLTEGDAWHLDSGHAFNFFPGTDRSLSLTLPEWCMVSTHTKGHSLYSHIMFSLLLPHSAPIPVSSTVEPGCGVFGCKATLGIDSEYSLPQ